MTVSAYRLIPPEHLKGLLRLNLGCGLRKLAGFVNIDSRASVAPDLVHDVTAGLPYEENAAAEVQAIDFLEHLPRAALIPVLNEAHRVLDPAGHMLIRVPNALSKAHPEWAFGDPTHDFLFVRHTFDYFTAGHEQWLWNGRSYGIRPWTVVHERMLDVDGTIEVTLRPVKDPEAQPETGSAATYNSHRDREEWLEHKLEEIGRRLLDRLRLDIKTGLPNGGGK